MKRFFNLELLICKVKINDIRIYHITYAEEMMLTALTIQQLQLLVEYLHQRTLEL